MAPGSNSLRFSRMAKRHDHAFGQSEIFAMKIRYFEDTDTLPVRDNARARITTNGAA
jgi:hypothetical protein